MKPHILLIILFALMFSFPGCSQINEEDKTEAKNIYTYCNPIAETWLHELDKTGYSFLNNLKQSDIAKELMTEKNETDLQEYIRNSESTFGKVRERKFVGAHFWLHNDLLTYFPDNDNRMLDRIGQTQSKDGFYKINPGSMGLSKSSDMFKSFPEGDYVIFMYQVVPTNKAFAEEMLIFGRDKAGAWQILSYEIADDI